jgi:putative membrane protein
MTKKSDPSLKAINAISVIVPLTVAILLGIQTKVDLGYWTKSLPLINAIINGTTALLLLLGLYFIKAKNIAAHQKTMTLAFSLGGMFLVSYVLYHLSNASTPFEGVGNIRYFYYFNLISHILASLVVLPFVLRAFYFGYYRLDYKHQKVAKMAYPIWLYVSITGVIAYLMIAPYYTH